MTIHIQLDQQQSIFTNLDQISGNVFLRLNHEDSFSAITVKLESESQTYITHHTSTDKSETVSEVHKLLYKLQSVFPPPNHPSSPPRGAAYTLQPGQHVFPFQFKIPFNNSCWSPNPSVANMGGARAMLARDTNRHSKRPLPPSMSGFPGEAEIRYYVKVTAQRPAFYKENYRATVPFKFLPIEPPRPQHTRRESYARRQHQFAPFVPAPEKPSLFRKSSSVSSAGTPPSISIDARLPDPAIITCNEPLPLRVLVRKLNETSENLLLNLFQITLIGYTKIRALQHERVRTSSWVICSLANMHVLLHPEGPAEDAKDKEPVMVVDKGLWSNTPLPNTVPPSFDTCNLSRWYEIEVRLGLQWGTPGNIKPELTIQPLRMSCTVYSGIAPPPALLASLESYKHLPQTSSAPPTQPVPPPRLGSVSHVQFTANSTDMGSGASGGGPEGHDDPPPSYEDAMAEDLAPVDGPRRDYHVTDSAPMQGDDKRGLGRLFSA